MTYKQKIMIGMGLLYIGYGVAVQNNTNAAIYFAAVAILLGLTTILYNQNVFIITTKVFTLWLVQALLIIMSKLYLTLPSLFILALANSINAQALIVTDKHEDNSRLVRALTIVLMVFIMIATSLPLYAINILYEVGTINSSLKLIIFILFIFLPHLLPYAMHIILGNIKKVSRSKVLQS